MTQPFYTSWPFTNMSLRSIRAECAAELKIDVSSASEKAYLDLRINDACKEIWESRDLPHCLREQIFSVDTTSLLAAMPSYVHSIRAIRHYESRLPLSLRDTRPRFQSNGWTEPLWGWRIKGKSPTSREILSAGCLTLSIPEAETAEFSVVITGQTANANRLSETVTFAPGETEKVTAASFLELESIAQPALHANDVTVEDIDGNELAVLPNNEYTSSYTIVQVHDNWADNLMTPMFAEVLFKPKIYPLVNDYDEFPLPGYDKAIFWKVMELKANSGEEGLLFHGKCEQLIMDMAKDATQGTEKRINFAPEPLYGLFTC